MVTVCDLCCMPLSIRSYTCFSLFRTYRGWIAWNQTCRSYFILDFSEFAFSFFPKLFIFADIVGFWRIYSIFPQPPYFSVFLRFLFPQTWKLFFLSKLCLVQFLFLLWERKTIELLSAEISVNFFVTIWFWREHYARSWFFSRSDNVLSYFFSKYFEGLFFLLRKLVNCLLWQLSFTIIWPDDGSDDGSEDSSTLSWGRARIDVISYWFTGIFYR